MNTVCLYGQLGSGKTTFTQGLGSGFGLKYLIPSPTFIIVRQYPLKNLPLRYFNHIDLYRLEKKKEIENSSISEIISEQFNFNVIEWANKLGSLLPVDRLDIRFIVLADDKRKIKFSFAGSTKKIPFNFQKIFHK